MGMSIQEAKVLRDSGYDHQALKKLKIKYREYGNILPFVVTCSAHAKLLHFNGAVKPWTLEELDEQPLKPLCALPSKTRRKPWENEIVVRVLCEQVPFVTCADLWNSYISPDDACALKDFDKEWRDEEAAWTKKFAEDS